MQRPLEISTLGAFGDWTHRVRSSAWRCVLRQRQHARARQVAPVCGVLPAGTAGPPPNGHLGGVTQVERSEHQRTRRVCACTRYHEAAAMGKPYATLERPRSARKVAHDAARRDLWRRHSEMAVVAAASRDEAGDEVGYGGGERQRGEAARARTAHGAALQRRGVGWRRVGWRRCDERLETVGYDVPQP